MKGKTAEDIMKNFIAELLALDQEASLAGVRFGYTGHGPGLIVDPKVRLSESGEC